MKPLRGMVLVSGDARSIELGADELYKQFENEIKKYNLEDEISLSIVSDTGRHDALPLAIIYPEAIIYGPLSVENVKTIVEEHLYKGRTVESLLAPQYMLTGSIAWVKSRRGTIPAEQRILLERVGFIDPEDINDYIANGGYLSLGETLSKNTPDEVINIIQKSGLRGRGGAGFPTGLKWRHVANAKNDIKYVIVNADESEPGTFKDRLLLEGDPHSIIEAMTIAGYATGANIGYIYVRGEYALAYQRLQTAIDQANEYGLLGNNILDSGFDFEIHIHSGAGAYICGEETALIESIEGKRGEPRSRPPYPTTFGLWGKPTLVNNVETLANIPPILHNGPDWLKQFGTESSPGTKLYTILGNVNSTGLIEVPMGITLREVITIYANGMKPGSNFKLAQTGGSSGSIIPASLQDTPMDFDSFNKAGVSLGSGALLICDEETCVVDLARVLLNFFRKESCAKCNPCRIGNQRAYQILTKISEGLGEMSDLDDLILISKNLFDLSNCGLGQTAATPIKDILKHFRAEVEAHIKLKVCPSGACSMSGHLIKINQ